MYYRRLIMSQDSQSHCQSKFHGKIRCAILLPLRPEINDHNWNVTNKAGLIQISPSREGPWTTMKLNYAAPAACWRFGNDVVASEVSVNNGNRYVDIRSLVSVTNNTDFFIDLLLKSNSSEYQSSMDEEGEALDKRFDARKIETEEFFEIEKYAPSAGWISYSSSIPIANQSKHFSENDGHKVRTEKNI